LGFNETQTVLLIYLITACLGIGGIELRAGENLRAYLGFLQSFFMFVIIVILMLAERKLSKEKESPPR
jgi:hypothetical protein